MSIDLYHQAVAEIMYEELDCQRLVVALAPCWGWMGDDGRARRIVEERNPDWYRQLCDQFPSGRRRPRRKRHGDTLIKRRHTLRALAEIGRGECTSLYAQRVWPFVERRAAQIQIDHRQRHAAWYIYLEINHDRRIHPEGSQTNPRRTRRARREPGTA